MVRRIFTIYLDTKSLVPVCDEPEKLCWKNKIWTTKKGTAKGGREFDAGTLHTAKAPRTTASSILLMTFKWSIRLCRGFA